MRNVVYVIIVCAGTALVALTVPPALGQLPVAPGDTNTATVTPRQPGGLLGDQLGTYLTIEGVRSEGTKIETGTLLVDTVDSKKLDKPISLVIRGAAIVNHNLQPAGLNRPASTGRPRSAASSGDLSRGK